MKVLLIEDTLALAQTIVRYLTNQNISCTLREDGETGYTEAMHGNYDAIILDISLPKMDGITLCQKLRSEGNMTPVLMLTSRSSQDDVVYGLEQGADDYMTKPCDYRELVARLHSLNRRDNSEKTSHEISIGKLKIFPSKKRVFFNEKEIELSKREYALITYFATHSEYTIPKSELLEQIWGIHDNWEEGKVLEVYIGYLRKKIPGIIKTRKGHGYILNPEGLKK